VVVVVVAAAAVAAAAAAVHDLLDVRTSVPSCKIANNVMGAVSKEMAKVRDARHVE
jgi:hypothetical protein